MPNESFSMSANNLSILRVSIYRRTAMKRNILLICLTGFVVLSLHLIAFAQSYNVKMEFDLKVPMRDGTKLSADIYRPDASGKFPVILLRTPYDNHSPSIVKQAMFFAEHGYVFVAQDVRGRHDSEGDFYPYKNEALDGYDTQEWCGTQPWSDGNVALTQWYPAPLRNPHLKTMVVLVSPPDPLYNFPYENGAIMPSAVSWLAYVHGHSNQNVEHINWSQVYKHLPLTDMDNVAGYNLTVWDEWMKHPMLDDYWRSMSYESQYNEIDVPILHISGWYDDDQPGTMRNYVGMVKHGRTEHTRMNQKLVMGPWPHAVNTTSKLGELDFGPTALIDLSKLELRWFDYWLKNIDNGIMREPKVRIFVMGENIWRDEHEWPLARTNFTKFYLHSGGNANSRFGDGTLSTEPPKDEPPDRYTYDPSHPVPFITDPTFSQIGGPDDYQAIERRDDILVFTSPELTEDLEVTGPISATVYAASDRTDTDFTVKLLDVYPDGRAIRLTDGIIRARYRNSLEKPEYLLPNKPEKFTIDCWATSNVFKKGHRIRVEISSSAFPKFDRNLNTGGILGLDSVMVAAHQTVYHESRFPSYVLLPIIPKR